MSILDDIFEKAKEKPQRVAFPECTEEKILLTARACADEKLCVPYLVGDLAEVTVAAEQFGISLEEMVLVDAAEDEWLGELAAEFLEQNPVFPLPVLKNIARNDSIYTAMMMQALGRVDVSFAGLTHATVDVILVGKMIIGLREGINTVSSSAVFHIPGYEGPEGELLGFGDSAVCVNPTSDELADIAISACETMRDLLGWEPRCALLSYSTLGSGAGELVDKVKEAVKIANEKRPDLKIDGEFQLDSAVNPRVAAAKVKRESAVAGKANVIIWPDINTGNIGVKLVQNFAQADAYGPFLQGFRKIVCDCSRGAQVSELVGNIAMSCVRAQALKGGENDE